MGSNHPHFESISIFKSIFHTYTSKELRDHINKSLNRRIQSYERMERDRRSQENFHRPWVNRFKL